MPKRMLIDASHPEETRVVVLDGNKVEDFDFEAASKRPLKGNIYLAKVTRVEPSLQAAFVEYGGNRQGFLAFSEIHPDYYQIPVADRMAILAYQTQRMMAEDEDGFDAIDTAKAPDQDSMLESNESDEHGEHSFSPEETAQEESADRENAPARADDGSHPDDHSGDHSGEASEEITHDDRMEPAESGGVSLIDSPASDSTPVLQTESTGAPNANTNQNQRGERRGERNGDRPRPPRRRQYKIQEVIKRRQVILIQVVKEERGNKGASLTTYLSLAGRYCVLMPNTPRGGGISRKITNANDRKRLKSAAQSLELPEGMGLIIRTAGANRTKLEIKRDYEYLLRLWDTVRELTLRSNAPALVYEEGSLIKRAIRDSYSKDISEILVDGEAGYRDAKDFMRMLMPSHAKNVKLCKEPVSLFQRYQVEAQLDAMFSPVVQLKSGGYIVINQTEALVSIDVNSGKATREHSIEETATKTNLEAADEVGRQLRLRDLAGLIVIDFIDMEDSKNDRNVEKRLHNAVRNDRARIQLGKISQFGLMELSRQRLRAGVLAGSTVTCPHCAGQGIIRSTESAALKLLRALDEDGQRAPAGNLTVKAPPDVVIYTLNQKRHEIARIENMHDLAIIFEPVQTMMGGSFEIERTGQRVPSARPAKAAISPEAGFQNMAEEDEVAEPEEAATDPSDEMEHVEEQAAAVQETSPPGSETAESADGKKRRRRRRRGGRGRERGASENGGSDANRMHGNGTDLQSLPSSTSTNDGFAGTDDEGEDIIPSATAPGTGDEPGAAMGETTEKRRRRRRGRRGRRRDGEPGITNPATGNLVASESPLPDRSGFPAGEVTQDVRAQNILEPAPLNAPSAPQWSLADRSPEGEQVQSGPVLQEPEAPQSFRSDVPDLVLAAKPVLVSSTTEEDVQGASLPTASGTIVRAVPQDEAGKSQEARKGWWQRRFNL